MFMEWLKSKNFNSHAIAGVIVSAAALIIEDSEARNFVLQLFQAHPKLGTAIVAIAGIVFKYSHSSTTKPSDAAASSAAVQGR